MKSLKKIIPLVVIITLSSQCSKDLLSSIENEVTMNGSSFPITVASILGTSISGQGHTVINLMSGTTSQVQNLTIDIDAISEETLEGTYSYPLEGGDGELDNWLTNYTAFEGTTQVSSTLEEGIVTLIHNSGKNYTIELYLLMKDETIFEGSYTGYFQVQFNNN